jgi:hypothetical protein
MKKVYLSAFGALLISGLSAQSLSVSQSELALETTEKIMYGDLLVTNLTEGNLSVRVRQEAILTVADEELQICWGGLCFDWTSGSFMYTVPAFLEGNQVYEGFAMEYKANSASSGSVWKVCFWVVGNPADEVCIDVTYGTVGISETAVATMGKAWPNPSTEEINIPYFSNSGNEVLLIRNLMGQEVGRHSLRPGEGSVKLDVISFQQGIYFYSMVSGGEILGTGRFSVGR